jgi:hypothetical protein
MPTHKSDYHRERERREQMTRKRVQEETRTDDDAEYEQCLIAYAAYIQALGMVGFMKFKEFQRDWLKQRGIMQERRCGR